MSKVVACIIARTVSKRLPLKVLRSLGEEMTMLDFLIKRLKLVSRISEIYLCTSHESVDDILEDIAARNDIKIYRGDSSNILERMMRVGQKEDADYLIRITGDNPLTAYEYLDQQISLIKEHELDYIRLVDVPIGATAEVVSFDALERCAQLIDPQFSEYLMLYLFEPNNFKCGVLKPFEIDYSAQSITVDTPEDLKKVRELLSNFHEKPELLKLKDIIEQYVVDADQGQQNHNVVIKLPQNKTVPLNEFLEDMRRRKLESQLFLTP